MVFLVNFAKKNLVYILIQSELKKKLSNLYKTAKISFYMAYIPIIFIYLKKIST